MIALNASIILIGDGTHGTQEFYHERAEITKRLIAEAGYSGVVLEADFPSTYRVDRFVNGKVSTTTIPPHSSSSLRIGGGFLRAHSGWGGGPAPLTSTWTPPPTPSTSSKHLVTDEDEALDSLHDFEERFPTWMWANSPFLDFVGWARDYVSSGNGHISIAGADIYSLFTSTRAVVDALKESNAAEAAKTASKAYECFDMCGARAADDAQLYGMQAAQGKACEAEALRVAHMTAAKFRATLDAVKAKVIAQHQPAGESTSLLAELDSLDTAWAIDENAKVVESAEGYYRTMFTNRRASSWNARDGAMSTFISRYRIYLGQRAALASGRTVPQGTVGKLVVWMHNSHLGDARATGMGARGEWNVGQLLRQSFGADVVTVLFTTATGSVTAAHEWDGPACRQELAPPLPTSLERVFSTVSKSGPHVAVPSSQNLTHEPLPRFLVDIKALESASLTSADARAALEVLQRKYITRHVGVIYKKETELYSHYTPVKPADCADFYVHVDHTRALEPLARAPLHKKHHMDSTPALEETYPTGL